MKRTLVFASLSILWIAAPATASAAEVDARPPNRLTLSAGASRQDDVDDGGIGSLNYLHYFTPNALFGVGAEHQFIGDAKINFGSLRGAWGRGEQSSRTTLFADANVGEGEDGEREFDYSVFALGINQALTSKISVELEAREFDIDTTTGTLPKVGLSYLWSPRLLTYVSYAKSFGGNLGTELTTGRLDYYGSVLNLKLGGASGRANPAVLVPITGVTIPATQSKQAYLGIGKVFRRGEVQLLADWLKAGEAEKVTLTLSFTAYLGARVTQ